MSEAVMRRLAKPLLFLAAFIWGTSFFIMKNTLDAVPPFWLLVFRFTTGAVLLGLFCWKKWRTHFTWDYLWRGGLFGVFLFIAYTTQTFGLTGTTPSKNAFLTATYCVLVPFLAWRVFHRRPDRYNLLAAFLCITGVGLVLGLVLNCLLGFDIWDYSNVPLNLLGQVCLPYSFLWMGISLPAMALCELCREDSLEEQARKIFTKKKR